MGLFVGFRPENKFSELLLYRISSKIITLCVFWSPFMFINAECGDDSKANKLTFSLCTIVHCSYRYDIFYSDTGYINIMYKRTTTTTLIYKIFYLLIYHLNV